MRTWTFPQVHPPGDGPWRDEPDKAQWVDETTGLDCLTVRNRMGAWCGYVGVPPDHPWHGSSYDDLPVVVHGGLTFAGPCQDGAEDGPGVCHVPEPGRPADVWWLGFDCAHAGDLVPSMRDLLAGLPEALLERHVEVYRTIDYARTQVLLLAQQVNDPDGDGMPWRRPKPETTTLPERRAFRRLWKSLKRRALLGFPKS